MTSSNSTAPHDGATASLTPDITGRDKYIMAKALAYAVDIIDRLPPRWQEASDHDDMKALLSSIVENDDYLAVVISGANRHLSGGLVEMIGGAQ